MKWFSLAVLAAIASTVQAGDHGCCAPTTCKVCVRVTKEQKKTVWSAKCEDYCLPKCRLHEKCGECGTCDNGKCGKPRVRHLLVIKKVKTCDTTECVPVDQPCC